MSNVLGIILGLSGSVAINTGNNLQSLGMYKLEKESQYDEDLEDGKVSICSSTTWVLGTVVFLVGALLNFASYGFAPQSTLASLEAIQFVTNLFLGKMLLKRRITKRMYLGTFFTVGGTVMAVLFSSKDGAEIEVISDLTYLWRNWLWLAYIIFVVVLAAGLTILNTYYKRKGKTRKLISRMAVLYAVFSALFGTLSVVFAKVLAELLELQTEGENIFKHWFTYITLLSWLGLMVYWLLRLNNALALYNPLLIIPLLQVNFIFFAIVSGGIYFQEFNSMPAVQWVEFVLGVVFMFTGIYLMVPSEDLINCSGIQTRKSRRSTIKPSQRKLSKYMMVGASKTNDMEFERRLTDGVRDDNSVQHHLDIPVDVEWKVVHSSMEEKDSKPEVTVMQKLKLVGPKNPVRSPSKKRKEVETSISEKDRLEASIPMREISKSASQRAEQDSSSDIESSDENAC